MPAKGVEAAINDQITMEFQAAHLYLSMSAWLEEKNFPGFAKWMRIQSDEERGHAMRLYDYLIESGGRVRLEGLEAPATEFEGPMAIMQASLAHEKKVTASIRKLYELAEKEKDYAAQLMLQWFIKEQVEEEKQAQDVVARLKMAGDSSAALLFIDSQLGSRGPEKD